jgi:transporter family-2 protein
VRPLPAGPALALVLLGGVASAGQSLANAELGERLGRPVMGAVVNNATALAILAVAVAVSPAMRAGLRKLRDSRLPWWTYLGGLGGALFVVGATYAVPALGVAVFTIAQVAGGSAGGLAVDRAGLAPAGRLALSAPRVGGAVLGVAAVTIAQVGRPVGDLAVGLLLLAVAGGVGVALQTALNGRLSRASTPSAGLTANMLVSTPLVLAVALASGAFAGLSRAAWPADAWLYLGGPLALFVITTMLIGVQAAGVLRTGLAVVAGQLAGAIVLDLLAPGGPPVGPALLAGSALTFAAVAVSGLPGRSRPGWQTGAP